MTLSTPSHAGTIAAVAASGPGALPGYEFRCGGCTEVARFTVRGMTEDHARSHARYMTRRAR